MLRVPGLGHTTSVSGDPASLPQHGCGDALTLMLRVRVQPQDLPGAVVPGERGSRGLGGVSRSGIPEPLPWVHLCVLRLQLLPGPDLNSVVGLAAHLPMSRAVEQEAELLSVQGALAHSKQLALCVTGHHADPGMWP